MPPSTPRRARRGGGGGSGGSRRGIRAQAGPPKGLFETLNSKWYCDCTPRIQAAIRTVQKDGKNKGRKFWTCAQDRRDQCGFFLWDDDARARELEAQEAAGQPPSTQRFRQTRLTDDGGSGMNVFTQTAPPETPTRPRVVKAAPTANEDDDSSSSSSSSDTDAQIARDDAPGPSAAGRSQRSSVTATNAPLQSSSSSSSRSLGRPSPSQQAKAKTKKRKYDDYSDSDFEGSDIERNLAELIDSVVASTSKSGRQRKGMPTTVPTTPSKSNNPQQKQRDAAGLPPTPVSRHTLLIAREGASASSSSHKRVRLSTPTGGISSPTSSPTPRTSSSGAQAVGDAHDDDDEEGEDYAVTREVLAILSAHVQQHPNQQKAVVPDPALLRSAVRGCLDAWALRAEGVRRGRDLVREGIASRDARIAELQETVAALERERAVDRRRMAEYREAAKKLLED